MPQSETTKPAIAGAMNWLRIFEQLAQPLVCEANLNTSKNQEFFAAFALAD